MIFFPAAVFGNKTHKAFGVGEVMQDALREGVDTISVISSGNYIGTILEAVRQRNLGGRFKVVNLVNAPRGLDCTEIQIEERRILRDAAEREAYVAQRLANAGKTRDYTDFQPAVYKEIAKHILRDREIMGLRISHIGVGVGTGKLFLALAQEIQEQGLETKLIGILPEGENGVFNDDNLEVRDGKLYYKEFNPQSPADKLVCPYTIYKSQLLATRDQGHRLIEVTPQQIIDAYGSANLGWKIPGEPSACASFVIDDPHFRKRHELEGHTLGLMIHTGLGDEGQRSYETRHSLAQAALANPQIRNALRAGNWCV
jgi:hypothetical protein